MRINEITEQVDLSKRAIKFYEEKGLLKVSRDENGYRNYSEENLMALKEISIYRKLGIDIRDIRLLLDGKKKDLLEQIYEEKKHTLHEEQEKLNALLKFMRDHDVNDFYQMVDYQTIGQAMQDVLPGFYGYYFMQHFQPYLQIPMTTQEQKDAYKTIVDFWDHIHLRIPLLMKLSGYLICCLMPQPSLERMTARMEQTLQMYLHPSDKEYAALCRSIRQNVRLQNSLLRYHPFLISKRRLMKRLQDCGYNDIFIPAMERLSPLYREYREAMMQMNERVCKDLGLHYDSGCRLVMAKKD